MAKYTKRVAVYCVCPKCLWFAEETIRDRGTFSDAIKALVERMVDHLNSRCAVKELMLELREYHEVPPAEGKEREGAMLYNPDAPPDARSANLRAHASSETGV